MEGEVTTGKLTAEDRVLDATLRPRRLDDFIGQGSSTGQLKIFIEAARNRNEPLDHVLLSGPPGLGKTTLALIVANEMGVPVSSTSGPAIERPSELASMLTNLPAGEGGPVLFIDEIHRLPRNVEELLYPAMEDFCIDIMIGKGPGARSVKLDLPRFTLVGATTRVGLITKPLLTRFGVPVRLDYYPVDEMERIVDRSAAILGIEMDAGGRLEIARRSRGTPRVANRLLRRVRDFAEVKAESVIDVPVAVEAMKMLRVDDAGLDVVDKAVLETIIDKFSGGPVGLKTLAASIGEEPDTLEEMHEPFLMQLGFIKRTPSGRVATPLAYKHLGREMGAGQTGLF